MTLDKQGMQLIGDLGCLFLKKHKLYPRAVGGMTLGADPVAMAIAMASPKHKMNLNAFIVRKEPKSHGTARWLEGTKSFSLGEKLLLLEDVVTTGGSGIRSVRIVQEAGFQALGLLSIVDRMDGASEACKKEGMPFFSLCTVEEIRKQSRDKE